MIVLVTNEQQQILDHLAQGDDRFEREFEIADRHHAVHAVASGGCAGTARVVVDWDSGCYVAMVCLQELLDFATPESR